MTLEEKKIEETKWKTTFSVILNQLMNKKDVSINAVANQIDVDPKTLRNYINKESVPTATVLKRLADYFEVSTDYLIYHGQCNTSYSDKTVLELATIIKNFDVVLEKNSGDDAVTLHINDKVLSLILKELYFSRESTQYDSIADNLSRSYGRMKVHQKHLVDYATFQNLIRHEYVYHGLEEDMMLCTDENGNDCYGVDPYTFDEIEKRSEEWENMNSLEREQWWETYCKEGL